MPQSDEYTFHNCKKKIVPDIKEGSSKTLAYCCRTWDFLKTLGH